MKCSICGKDAKTAVCLVCQLEENEYYYEEKKQIKARPQVKKPREDFKD